ncbi:MAG: hypothetical protein IJR13_07520 [Bacteroidales bacterium]|nr:hypothetical protein [Bacteroidales bacterium]
MKRLFIIIVFSICFLPIVLQCSSIGHGIDMYDENDKTDKQYKKCDYTTFEKFRKKYDSVFRQSTMTDTIYDTIRYHWFYFLQGKDVYFFSRVTPIVNGIHIYEQSRIIEPIWYDLEDEGGIANMVFHDTTANKDSLYSVFMKKYSSTIVEELQKLDMDTNDLHDIWFGGVSTMEELIFDGTTCIDCDSASFWKIFDSVTNSTKRK